MRSKILEMLRNAGSVYISGEEIASRLGVSRTAVWKHIRELREAGYDIRSHSRSGYMLCETPDLLLPGEIRHDLNTKIMGQKIVYYEDIPSTNIEAKRLAAEGAPEGTVVVSEAQSTGRGRMERAFFSPKGKGIWFSIFLRAVFLPQEAPKCTLLAAVAVAKAMDQFGLRAGIKWPNDVLYEGKKLVGILTEMHAEMDRINYVVIGTGINVNIMPEEFPPELRDCATSLAIMKGEKLPRAAFFRAVLQAIEELYLMVRKQGFASLMEEWRHYTITLGQEVNVISVNETFAGRAVDIDADGALLVETEQGVRRVLAGDVSIRPRK